MRLADDRRGRVPFALVAVLLLVGSAAVVATDRPRRYETPAVDRVVGETVAAAQTALRQAAVVAARESAANPVVAPVDTPYGRVVNDSSPFRDALRIRASLLARSYLSRIGERRGDVVSSVSLPPVRSPADLRAAKRRVSVERAGPNGTALRVRFRGVTVRAKRDGRVIAERRVSPVVTVASPALALHDRVAAFERALNAGPLDGGLGRRLAIQLYALAWARGYAQYAGAPVENVVANRHVEVATNAGALAVQRETLGATASGGERAVLGAAARVAATDLLAASGVDARWTDAVVAAVRGASSSTGAHRPVRSDGHEGPEPVSVRVNHTADRALVDVLGTREASRLSTAVDRGYSVDARLFVRARRTGGSTTGATGATGTTAIDPGGNWTLVDRRRRTSRRVLPGGGSAPVRVPTGWRAFERYDRRVVVTHTTVSRWRRGAARRVTRRTRTERHAVSIALAGRHSPDSRAPRVGVAGVYERGGPLDGPNLAGVPAAARRRLVASRGGPDALARRAVRGTLDREPVRLAGARPDGLRAWLRRDLVALHRRVRSTAVALPRGAVATYGVNPSTRLAARLRVRRAELLDAPTRYAGVADKVRVAVRRAYLDRVLARLDERAAARDRTRGNLNEALDGTGIGSLDRLRAVRAVGGGPSPVERPPPDRGLGGPLALAVETEPAYLRLDPVARERLGVAGRGTVTPLDARNTNLFTLPYGDAADAVTRGLLGSERVSLRTAALILRAERRATGGRGDRDLRRAVSASTDRVRDRMATVLAAAGVGVTDETPGAVVDRGLSRWRTPAGRALAVTNGSAIRAVVAVTPGVSDAERAALAARLEVAVSETLASPSARPPETAVAGSVGVVRAAVREGATRAAEYGVNRTLSRFNRTFDAIFVGLPVAPVPGYWYATLNVWDVHARGTYERLVVRSRRGASGVAYVRDGGLVRLDVDGDGARERLGRAERVAFETRVPVAVVVPPGRRGVGDLDGDADERSPGYG
ncbi:DUF7286 family protein [Halomarina pelagica]|uniref:DUF7286 family protein n=1 Tax=Halomarina pelagica TaxID=2961599 RepID=UPI0020C440A1|nr:hypothetical protein [Halomarina sp. BND7]